ncbi:hypothetical protein GOP47_0009130 [Adiantum capillus-veneris]|uniref:Pentatricopeptide repeat-containing protein n=1 Tax=Adiantum capillus-veneris TaxID=13818 RepID=A0A9D4ZLD3_ADICA|nr:hypothetical protein GOP47_0009130 [Adiantum capillus-veneris]
MQGGLLHQALSSTQSLHARDVRPNPSSYACFLQRCARSKALLAGHYIHARIIADGIHHGDSLFGKLLLEMYGNCGCPDDAYKVFHHVQHKDLQCWNMMIAAYSHVDHIEQVFKLLHQMLMQQVRPDDGTLSNVLVACTSASSLTHGRLVHTYMILNSLLTSVSVINALITMYGNCGSLCSTRKVFLAAQHKDVVTWTAIISAFAKQGHATEALDLSKEMLSEDVEPDRVTFISILDACANLEASEMGKIVHTLITEMGIHIDVVLGTAVLNMYGKCGCLQCARLLFQTLQRQSVVAWNAMITAYVQSKLCKEALQLFYQMLKAGVKASKVTFISTLNACVKPQDLAEGMLLHHFVVENGICARSDIIVGTSLLSMYSECGSLYDAQNVFDSLSRKNVVSWTALLSAYVKHEKYSEVLVLFSKLDRKGISPNPITFLTVLDACANAKVSTSGDLAFSLIIEDELKLDSFLKTSLVSMYGKCGRLEDAKHLFVSVSPKNVVLYTAIIAAYAQCNHGKEALLLFQQMCQEGLKPDKYTYSGLLDAITGPATSLDGKIFHSLILEIGMESETCVGIALLNMYRNCGTLDDAVSVFVGLPTHNIVSFNAMLAIYAQHQEGYAAFELFQRVQNEGFSPDHVTFISTLDACAGSIDLVQAKSLHVNLVGTGVIYDTVVKTALLNMYSKCGDFKGANDIFESLLERDVAAWNAMIAAFADHGRGKEALELFKRMRGEGVNPDGVTLASVLLACSRAGLTKVGREYFDSMSAVYGVEPTVEHYACMVDAYGRAGLLNEAEDLLKKMPNHPSPVAWLAFLSACKVHRDVKRAKHAADRIFELDPKHTGARLMLSNIYAVAGMWNDATSVISKIT